MKKLEPGVHPFDSKGKLANVAYAFFYFNFLEVFQ